MILSLILVLNFISPVEYCSNSLPLRETLNGVFLALLFIIQHMIVV